MKENNMAQAVKTEIKTPELKPHPGFEAMEKGSFYTVVGAGGDLQEWCKAFVKLLSERGISAPKYFTSFTGEEMNSHYRLIGENKYLADLTFFAFPITDMEIGSLALFKIKMGDRWFDDIVNNNKRRNGRC